MGQLYLPLALVPPLPPAAPCRPLPPPVTPALCPLPHQVQTNGRKTPIAVVSEAITDLEGEVGGIRKQFMEQCQQHQDGGGPPLY